MTKEKTLEEYREEDRIEYVAKYGERVGTMVGYMDSSFCFRDVKAVLKDATTEEINAVIKALDEKYPGGNWRTSDARQMLYRIPGNVVVGMGATRCFYTDREAYTVVEVSKSGRKITLQEDTATLLNGKELNFHVGGFSAHCSNQHDQKYAYEKNVTGTTVEARLTSKGWKTKGGAETIIIDLRAKFYDYNF